MASSSVLALSEKCEADSNDEAVTLALGSFMAIFAEIAKDQTPAPKANTQAPKTPREKWFDADSPEAKAITTPKPARTKKNAPAPALDLDAVTKLLAEILARG
jgi:hypothetical protein